MKPLVYVITLLMCIGLNSPMPSFATPKVSYTSLVKHRETNTCLLDNLINETRGVKGPHADEARVEITHLVLSRTKNKSFSSTPCGVIHQHSRNKHLHKSWCEFSWICTRQHVGKLDLNTVALLKRDIVKGVRRYRRMGPLKALYYTSNGTCPVKTRYRYKKGAFTFCVAAKN